MSSLIPFLALQTSTSSGELSPTVIIIYVIVVVIVLAGYWKVYTKANKPGWAAIIPIYNVVVWLEIIGRPLWWLILLLIPIVNIIILIVMYNDLAKSFGKGVGFTIGLILLSPIFILILGFGDAQYEGPAAA